LKRFYSFKNFSQELDLFLLVLVGLLLTILIVENTTLNIVVFVSVIVAITTMWFITRQGNIKRYIFSVVAGCLFSLMCVGLFLYDGFFTQVTLAERAVVQRVSIFGFVVSLLVLLMIRLSALRQLPTSRKLKRAVRISVLLPSVVSLVLVYGQNSEQEQVFGSRIWYLFLLIFVIGLQVYSYRKFCKHAFANLREERQYFIHGQIKNRRFRKK
jgi:MFS family permease